MGKRDLAIYSSFMQMLTQYGKMQVVSICKINRSISVGRNLIRDHLVQLADHFRNDQKLKLVIRDIIQISFEHWQAEGVSQEASSTVWPCSC